MLYKEYSMTEGLYYYEDSYGVQKIYCEECGFNHIVKCGEYQVYYEEIE